MFHAPPAPSSAPPVQVTQVFVPKKRPRGPGGMTQARVETIATPVWYRQKPPVRTPGAESV